MASQALYLKYRPRTFEEVVGQDPITRTLGNALRQGRFRHAYLFTGPRGTGKTTTARLLAKAVNCLADAGERPCNACPLCQALNDGRLMDLIEIDAASNRGIDEIRDLREKVNFRPSAGRFKVYILDEAHMLTGEAFNALLKTLEEPPPHVVFVLVTTEPHKIPATITSRCQRFDFRRVPLETMIGRLRHIAAEEGLRVEPEALEIIARQGGGAVRDAISLLDQLASYGDEIRADQVRMVLGTVAGDAANRVVDCLAEGDAAGGLDAINLAVGDGADPRQLGREVVEVLRGLLLIQQGAGPGLLNVTREQADLLEVLARQVSRSRVLRAIRLFNEATVGLRRGVESVPQLPLELALVESLLDEAGSAGGPARVRPEPPATQPVVSRPPSTAATRPAAAVEVAPQAEPVADAGAAAVPAACGPLALDRVQGEWRKVLNAMRGRNPTTQAVLSSGCRPVEVEGDQLLITVPSAILGEKLRDPQRTLELEQVLNEVLQVRCRVKLVLAADYQPRTESPVPAAPPSVVEETSASETLDKIADWAKERGGKAKLVRP
jgi:DNA polymerase III subunit gamma/tau